MDHAGAAVEGAINFHLLAYKLLGFVLIIQLVAHVVGLQHIFTSGLYHGSGESGSLRVLHGRGRILRRRTRLRTLLIGAGRLSILHIRAWLLGAWLLRARLG